MKIAIFHDYFDEIGGAEITLLYMARGINATIFTTNIDREKIREMGFSEVRIESVGAVPNIKYLKQILTQLKFSFIKIAGYDLYIFGGSFSIYASKNHSPNLWYCFSPLRGLYDLRYFKKGFRNIIKQPVKEILICFDKKAVKNIQKIIAPSLNVRDRIKRYYRRSCSVVNHPVDVFVPATILSISLKGLMYCTGNASLSWYLFGLAICAMIYAIISFHVALDGEERAFYLKLLQLASEKLRIRRAAEQVVYEDRL